MGISPIMSVLAMSTTALTDQKANCFCSAAVSWNGDLGGGRGGNFVLG